ncbi:response regulator transcription factor [Dactylococcopsis salina]|uniref:Response regulator with CheY-like receiver domain and winged-helix DNA-binding domain n=1 Tax=Dactylococcopsis salina (strain PCC 8305) TaxID=13035 RepID=K9YWI7_DACS8|nr:response regulator transcription factor [Dactylococcopsis salina]AFZ51269.1 response regulator with CheY-like receiver domain and winged-helix DNA-binding domain [Dactylococcopsis salina PCC 8305]
MKILIVEDDRAISEVLRKLFEQQNFIVEIAYDGNSGFAFATATDYKLILLDLMLPQIDGITLCRNLRNQGITIPILMLTAKDTSLDKVKGLDVGADDYVVKPFDPSELLARSRALLRRGQVLKSSILTWENLKLDLDRCDASYQQNPLKLTPKEYQILALFLQNCDRVLTTDQILDQVWTYDDIPGREVVKTHLRSLRKKLKALGAPHNLIENIYGVGYRLNPNY